MIYDTLKIRERIINRRLRDAIFAATYVMEKHWQMQKELHLVFIDLEKEYDIVSL